LINCIRSKFNDAAVPNCSERGCDLKLGNFNDSVVLKGERICRDRKMCDCIIFAEKGKIIIGIVELKSKSADPDEIEEKLINGSNVSLEILKACHEQTIFDFYPIVLSESWRRSEYRIIKKINIRIMGRKCWIIPGKCGVSLSEIISGYQIEF
jgi:hypothetical protein